MTDLSTSTVTSQSILEETNKITYDNLKLADEEMKEQVEGRANECADEGISEEKVKSVSVEETKVICASQTTSVWENVEVMGGDSMQEYVNSDKQMGKQCDESSESEIVKSLCDISASEDTIRNQDIVNKEETSSEEDRIVDEEESVKIETTQNQRLLLDNSQQNDPVEQVPTNSEITQNDSLPKENLEDQSCSLYQNTDSESERLKSMSCENIVVCQENESEVCERLRDATSNEVEAMEVSLEEIQDVTEVSKNIDNLENHDNVPSPHLYDSEMPLSQESTLDFGSFRNSSDVIKTDFDNEGNLVIEEDIIEEEKLPGCVSEGPLNDERYDVDINDSLEFVNEETSLQASTDAQINQELSNNQDSVDSHSDIKDDSSSYNVKLEDEQDKEDSNSFNVKLEDELDIQDTGSNIQSQDSQDTRPDEDSNCVQDNSSDLILPDSEVCNNCLFCKL